MPGAAAAVVLLVVAAVAAAASAGLRVAGPSAAAAVVLAWLLLLVWLFGLLLLLLWWLPRKRPPVRRCPTSSASDRRRSTEEHTHAGMQTLTKQRSTRPMQRARQHSWQISHRAYGNSHPQPSTRRRSDARPATAPAAPRGKAIPPCPGVLMTPPLASKAEGALLYNQTLSHGRAHRNWRAPGEERAVAQRHTWLGGGAA